MNKPEPVLANLVLSETCDYIARRIDYYKTQLPEGDAVDALRNITAIEELTELVKFQRSVIAKHRNRPAERFDRPTDSPNHNG